jgi:type II secretory pathway component PulJ
LALQWILTVVLAVVSVAAISAFVRARQVSRRLQRLSESYWELRYEYGQLNARLTRLEGASDPQHPAAAPGGAAAFVPLSSLKKM